ncbi:hypothetical protein T484DRAFT_1920632 [Baffinella frigidus]|nr:hypothetical protein T484DRAFT_1920632 [Cryptophyta sp. CCMP2293]
MDLLLEHGAKVVAIRDHAGIKLLSTAVFNGHAQVARKLIQLGEDVNQVDDFLCTPLGYCAIYSLPVVASVLLEHGANVLKAQVCGISALQTAERHVSPYAASLYGPQLGVREEWQIEAWDSAIAMREILRAEELRGAKCVAFAMGLHDRLGVDSIVRWLDPETLRMVLQRVGRV